MLGATIKIGDAQVEKPKLILDAESDIAHIPGAHFHPKSTSSFLQLDTFDFYDQDFALCTVCFSTNPQISDFALERSLREECGAQIRYFSPLVVDDAKAQYLRDMGNKVLLNWPLQKRGYNYRFYLVDSEQPSASACPAGNIYVTTGMMGALESDLELEAILAHEIAHVERRHAYRQYRRAQRGNLISAILGIAGAVAVGAATDNPGAAVLTGAAVAAIANTATSIALYGYSRREETEADSYALTYVIGQYGEEGNRLMLSVLSKLQYLSTKDGVLTEIPRMFNSHPDIHNRIAKAKAARVEAFAVPVKYGAYNKADELLILLSFEYQALFDYVEVEQIVVTGEGEGIRAPTSSIGSGKKTRSLFDQFPKRESKRVRQLQLFATVESTGRLARGAEISSITLRIDDTEVTLDNAEDTKVFPADWVGINFSVNDTESFLGDGITLVEVDTSYWDEISYWAPIESGR